MAYTNVLPRTKNINGSDCTGTNATINRTYTLPDTTILSSGLDIVVNGTTLMEGAGKDFTISANIITFLNIIWNDNIIRITYWITLELSSEATLSTSTSLKYATPIMFAEILGIKKTIPSWDVGNSPTNELVGTGDDSITIFYLDHQNILSDSYILYYGASASATTELEETTHYVLTNDIGKIVLTAAGVTLLSTNKIYATYSYISNLMKNSYLITVLSRAEKEINKAVNSTFTNGTAINPSYPVKTEYLPSEGLFRDRIIINKKPLIDVESALDSDITISDTTISLSTGGGATFPSSGYIVIGSEVIAYTGISVDNLTGCTRGSLNTIATTHSDGDIIHSTILFMSDTSEGTAVSWDIQPWNTSMNATDEGLIYRFANSDPDPLTRRGVANRIKIIYYYGYNTVPGDITRLALLLSKRMLIQDNIGSSMIQGRNEFRPEMFNVDMEEMKRIINSYIVLPMGNT